MCGTCGCDASAEVEHAHDHAHDHDHVHEHEDLRAQGGASPGRTVSLEARLLAKNDQVAADNRGWLARRRILALNVMGTPGAGKTALLERTVRALGGAQPVGVIEGDQQTDRDAARIRAAGAPVVQINTGSGCHLNAAMVAGGLNELDPADGSLVFVENVGNLVCPALFDVGEQVKVLVMSVTEGDDKPRKYPHMFRAADVLVLNKIELLPHVPFDVDRCVAEARQLSPSLTTFALSALRGEGVDAWIAWLRSIAPPKDAPAPRVRA